MSIWQRTAVGIDVSDGTLKAVKLARRGRRVRLLRAWRIPYYHEDPDPRRGGLAAIDTLLARARFGSRPRVVVSMPIRGAVSRTYLIPAMEADRIAEMVRYEVHSEVDAPPEDLVVRHTVRRGVEESQVPTYALKRADVDARAADLRAQGVSYDQLETTGYALASFIEAEMPRGRDRILLGVGEVSTDLVLLTERGVWMRQVPLGLADDDDAERLARRFKAEVDAAIRTLLPSDRPFAPHDLVLTEEGALDAGFTGALKQVLGLTVTRVHTLQRIDAPGRMDWDDQTPEQVLAMGKAFGLALAGLGLGRFRCPVEEGNPKREVLRLVPMAGIGVFFCALTLVALGLIGTRRAEALEQALPPELLTEWRDLASETTTLRDELETVTLRGDALRALAAARPAVYFPKRALVRAARLFELPGSEDARIEALNLAPPTADRAGRLTLILAAGPRAAADIGERLRTSLQHEFGEADLRATGEDPVTRRWTLEVPVR